jgi:transcription elongation factor GreB
MNSADLPSSSSSDDEDADDAPLPGNVRNYVTPTGLHLLKKEHDRLWLEERPRVVEIVSWAAGNGDRSENGDYLYGKKRLREIDRRIRFLRKRIESAEVVDPSRQTGLEKVFFGATVTYGNSRGEETTITIVGVDEASIDDGKISWLAPVARALHKAEEGDQVVLKSPAGTETLTVISVRYGS